MRREVIDKSTGFHAWLERTSRLGLTMSVHRVPALREWLSTPEFVQVFGHRPQT
jgi:hypothetical protein